MPDDLKIGSAYIDIEARSNVAPGIEEAQRKVAAQLRAAAASGEHVDPGIASFFGASGRQSLATVAKSTNQAGLGSGAQGLMESAKRSATELERLRTEAAKTGTFFARFSESLKTGGVSIGGTARGAVGAMAAGFTLAGLAGHANPAFGQRFAQTTSDLAGAAGRYAEPTSRYFETKLRQLGDVMADGSRDRTAGFAEKNPNLTSGLIAGGVAALPLIFKSLAAAAGVLSGPAGWAVIAAAGGAGFLGSKLLEEKAGAVKGASMGMGGFKDAGHWFDDAESVWKHMASGVLQSPASELKQAAGDLKEAAKQISEIVKGGGPPADAVTNMMLGIGQMGVQR